jgi:hypothetical protein
MKFVRVFGTIIGLAQCFDTQPIISKFLEGIPGNLSQHKFSSSDGPTIAPFFTASLRYKLADPSLPLGDANGTIVYDSLLEKYVMSTVGAIPQFGPDAIMNQTQIAYGSGKNASTYSATNGQCMHLSGVYAGGGFPGLFGWLGAANRTGQDTVKGLTCDKWSFTPPPPNDKYTLTACLRGDEPLYLLRGLYLMYFEDFQRGADPSKFQLPVECQTASKTCGSGKIVKKTIYVAHPEDNYNISGQDVADAHGDAVFLCTDKMMWTIGNYKLLSAFDLSIVDTYAQYTNFPPPGNQGFGGDGYHIGRETPVGIGRHGGQCDDDADWFQKLGIWYSLPRGGQCISYDYQLGVNCTWRIERRVNTIAMDCLFNQHAFLEMCNKSKVPFTDVTAALLKSLETQDVAHGGCSSVTTPMCKEHPACAHLEGDCCPHEDGTMLDCCNLHDQAFSSIVV